MYFPFQKLIFPTYGRFEGADPGVPLMPKLCEPQELLLKSEMGSTLAAPLGL